MSQFSDYSPPRGSVRVRDRVRTPCRGSVRVRTRVGVGGLLSGMFSVAGLSPGGVVSRGVIS